MIRKACRAGMFYPNTKSQCIQALTPCLSQSNIPTMQNIQASIVPHAGWMFSGMTAGKAFQAIKQSVTPDTFVIFGAVHVPGVRYLSLWPEGTWETPLGSIDIDSDLVHWLHDNANEYFKDNTQAHMQEHSIEVEIPFIQYLFPNAKIVPIATPFDTAAISLGTKLAEYKEKNIIVLASTDMTHYGYRFQFAPAGRAEKALNWVKTDNDQRMIRLIQEIKPEEVIPEAYRHYNACGAGAIAATLAFAKARGIHSATLLDYTTSMDVYPQGDKDSFVGYSSFIM